MTPDLRWHLCISTAVLRSQLWNNHQPPRVGPALPEEQQVLPVTPSACHLNGGVVVGSTEYPKSWLAGCHEYFIHQERRVMWLCYATSFCLRDLRRGSWSPAKSSVGGVCLLGWSHSTCICTISILHRLWLMGVLTAILKSGHFRNSWNKLEEEFYLVVFSKGISPWLQTTAFHKVNEYEVFSCPLATFSVSSLSCNSCI